jgi:hypothetical protein
VSAIVVLLCVPEVHPDPGSLRPGAALQQGWLLAVLLPVEGGGLLQGLAISGRLYCGERLLAGLQY